MKMKMNELIRDIHVERYYPPVTAPAQEMQAIAEVVNPELNLVAKRLWQLFCNTFVYHLDEAGARRWEGMLKLRPKVTDDLETRRRRILAKINDQLPYTYRQLENILNALCGPGLYDIDLNHNAYQLSILINPDATSGINRISKTLFPIIPANLALFVIMQIYQDLLINHSAASRQYVDAHHITWNLGAMRYIMRDGEFMRDGTIRYGGIYPDENYRDSQSHKAEQLLAVNARQGRLYSFAVDARQPIGARLRPVLQSASEQVLSVVSKQAYTPENLNQSTDDVDAHQYRDPRTMNCRDGSFCFNGAHMRQAEYVATDLHHNFCTVTVIKNNIEGVIETL